MTTEPVLLKRLTSDCGYVVKEGQYVQDIWDATWFTPEEIKKLSPKLANRCAKISFSEISDGIDTIRSRSQDIIDMLEEDLQDTETHDLLVLRLERIAEFIRGYEIAKQRIPNAQNISIPSVRGFGYVHTLPEVHIEVDENSQMVDIVETFIQRCEEWQGPAVTSLRQEDEELRETYVVPISAVKYAEERMQEPWDKAFLQQLWEAYGRVSFVSRLPFMLLVIKQVKQFSKAQKS